MTAVLIFGVTTAASVASAQDTSTAAPDVSAFVASAATLDRIRTALASESALVLNDDTLRFYVQVVARHRTFAEYLSGDDLRFGMERPTPYAAPGERPALGAGMGVDLLGLARSAIRGFRAARERRTIRGINEQIDRELEAIETAP